MPHVFQTKDKNGKPHPKWRFQYTHYTGRRKSATGFTSRKKTEKFANKIQQEHDEIRRGFRPPPTTKSQMATRDIEAVIQEYLNWGNCQGGLRGLPWGEGHARMRKFQIKWWAGELNLKKLGDLMRCQPQVQKIIQQRRNTGEAPKTTANYVDSLTSFCSWCSDSSRGYLPKNPLSR